MRHKIEYSGLRIAVFPENLYKCFFYIWFAEKSAAALSDIAGILRKRQI